MEERSTISSLIRLNVQEEKRDLLAYNGTRGESGGTDRAYYLSLLQIPESILYNA